MTGAGTSVTPASATSPSVREHVLKTWPTYFNAIERGEKTFEVRRNDRAFQTGDVVKLVCMSEDGRVANFHTTGRTLSFRIGWILQGGQFGIEPGFCVFSLAPIDDASLQTRARASLQTETDE